MDLFHENSDPKLSSQPTQLLQHALAPNSLLQSHEHSKDRGLVSPSDKGDATIDFSLDSRIIPARSSTPHYRLQDSLAHSPKRNDQHMLTAVDDSQEENIVPLSSRETGQLESFARTAETPSPPSLQGSSAVALNQYQHGDNALSASTGKAIIGARTITFQSPITTGPRPVTRATKSMPVGSRYYPRSPSPSSQDSFGGSVSQDPAERYLASTKQFDVPLADLGDTPTQDANNPEPEPGLTLPDASEHKEFLEAAMREYEAQRASKGTASSSNHHGNILVAATPSNSDESLGTSHDKDDVFSFRKLATDHGGQQSRYDFDGASSFDKMLDRDLADGPDPTPEPTPEEVTQPTDLNPTQVGEPVPFDRPSLVTPPQSGGQLSPSFQWVAPSPSAAVTASNPRSLFSMVHPKNQYRMAKMRNMGVEAGTQPSRIQEARPSHIQETQPSHLDQTPRPNSPPLSPLPSPTKAPSHRGHGYQSSADIDADDTLDVVPDSEPLRAGPCTPTPSHHRSGAQSPLKRSTRPPSPMSDQEPGDLPGSFPESEADIPLAIIASKSKRESPAVAGEMLATNRKPRSVVPAAPKAPLSATDGGQGKPTSAATKGKNPKAKFEPMPVPTSLPEQDLPSSSCLPNLPTAKQPGGKLVPQEPPQARATPTTSRSAMKTAAGKKRAHSSDTEGSEEWSHQLTEDGRNKLPLTREEEEDDTQEMHVDSPEPPPVKVGASRKKRRTEEDKDTKPARGVSKVSATTTRSKRSETPVAAAARSAKRLRSAGLSSIRGSTSESATRVFALWKKDGHYYPGVVHSVHPKNRYTIKFADGDDDIVELKNMRRYELIIGDRVIDFNDSIKGTVSNASQLESSGTLELQIDDGGVSNTISVEVHHLRIANRTVQSQWKDRTITAESIVPLVRPKLLLDATPSKQSVLSVTSTKAQREFAKTGFVVTLSPKNQDVSRTKEAAILSIKRHGGSVIEDWSSVFTMDGKHSHSNKRWAATPKDFRWKSNGNLDRVFLLSDDAHQKPKFLMALALGIPCLSFEWLAQEGPFSSDWQPHLLSAGYSDQLGARVSQLVDLDWGNCMEHLTDVLANRVAPKLFSEKTVLCIGVDLIPPPPTRGRKNAADTEGARYVPWIILGMGAARVEAVTDLKQVTFDHMRTFDYVVVKEPEDLGSVFDDLQKEVFVGNVKWVKECLTCSRIMEPVWD